MLPSQDCFNTATCLPCSFALCYCHPYIPVHCLEMIFTLASLGLRYMQYCIVVLLCVAKVQWGAHKALKPLCQAQCHMLQHCQRLETSASQGTSIQVVKGTAHTGMKDICTKDTVITFATFGVGQLKKYL